MATSLGVSQLRVEFCTGGSEDKIEPEKSPLLEAVARERLMKTEPDGKQLSGFCGYL
jgi:hypothetical protein